MSAQSSLKKAIEIFFSYAHEDEALRNELEKHLRNMVREGEITAWFDRKITAGREWENEISMNLNSAQVILLLVSPDFMASDYCFDVEVQRAIERHEAGEARVIPIILRPVDWSGTSFSALEALPREKLPVTSWQNRDEAFLNIARGIREVVNDLASNSESELPNLKADSEVLNSKRFLRTYSNWILIPASIATLAYMARILLFPNPITLHPECRDIFPEPGTVRVIASHPEGNKIRWWVAEDGLGLRSFLTCSTENCLDTIDNDILSETERHLESETVVDIAWDETNTQPREIWALTANESTGKLFKLTKRDESWSSPTEPIEQPSCQASELVIKSDKLLLGPFDAEQGMINSFDGNNWHRIPILNIPEATRFQVRIMLSNQRAEEVWLGTTSGLYRVSLGRVKEGRLLPPPSSLTKTNNLSVESLALSSNTLWIGSNQNGLLTYDIPKGTWTSIKGLPSSKITSIALSKTQKIAFITTDNGSGICQWNNEKDISCSNISKFESSQDIGYTVVPEENTKIVGLPHGGELFWKSLKPLIEK